MQGSMFGFGSARAPSCDPNTPSRIPAQLSDVGRADGCKDPKFAHVSRVYLKPFPGEPGVHALPGPGGTGFPGIGPGTPGHKFLAADTAFGPNYGPSEVFRMATSKFPG